VTPPCLSRYLASYEMPRFAQLRPTLHAACFPLMKLLPARFMLDRAEASGQLDARGHIAETTSGSFGLALALLAAARGHELTLVTASGLIDPDFKHRLEFLGARLLVASDIGGTGGQGARLEMLKAVLAERPGTFWPHQYDNLDNALAYSRLAELIVRAIGRVDHLVGCVGSGGSLCGTAGFLRNLFPQMRVVAVDTHNSILFGHSPGKRLLRGLGNSILPANLKHELVDEVHWVGALPAFAQARALYRGQGIYAGPTSGAAARVAYWVADRHPETSVVVIFPDEGYRYQQTLYNDTWLDTVAGWPPRLTGGPRRVDRIAPGGEADWTYFNWRGRSLEEALADV
jgi:cysteine synthase A